MDHEGMLISPHSAVPRTRLNGTKLRFKAQKLVSRESEQLPAWQSTADADANRVCCVVDVCVDAYPECKETEAKYGKIIAMNSRPGGLTVLLTENGIESGLGRHSRLCWNG